MGKIVRVNDAETGKDVTYDFEFAPYHTSAPERGVTWDRFKGAGGGGCDLIQKGDGTAWTCSVDAWTLEEDRLLAEVTLDLIGVPPVIAQTQPPLSKWDEIAATPVKAGPDPGHLKRLQRDGTGMSMYGLCARARAPTHIRTHIR